MHWISSSTFSRQVQYPSMSPLLWMAIGDTPERTTKQSNKVIVTDSRIYDGYVDSRKSKTFDWCLWSSTLDPRNLYEVGYKMCIRLRIFHWELQTIGRRGLVVDEVVGWQPFRDVPAWVSNVHIAILMIIQSPTIAVSSTDMASGWTSLETQSFYLISYKLPFARRKI